MPRKKTAAGAPAFDAVSHWIAFDEDARTEWPWSIHVVNHDKIISATGVDIPPARVATLLRWMSDAAFEASQAGADDLTGFMPVDGWRPGEPDFIRALRKLPLQYLVDSHVSLGLAKAVLLASCGAWRNDPAQSVRFLLDQARHNPEGWEVPPAEWRLAEDDFAVCRGFMIQAGAALHHPKGARNTTVKSLSAWRMKLLVEAVKAVYLRYGAHFRQRWQARQTGTADPIYCLVGNPSDSGLNAAILFMDAATPPNTIAEPGKPGRPASTHDLAQFADDLRKRTPPATWKEIAAEWNRKHPEKLTTADKAGSALKRIRKNRD